MRLRAIPFALAAAIAAVASPAFAQMPPPTWRAVLGDSGTIEIPTFPSGVGRTVYDVRLGDRGADQVNLRISSPSTLAGYWAFHQGAYRRLTQLNVTGNLGPGRAGAESGDVFHEMGTSIGSSPDGERNFFARAAAPGNAASATLGIWRWDRTRNLEVARELTDGALGPGLGAGWIFPSGGSLQGARMLNSGQQVIYARVQSPTGAISYVIAKHIPGTGNRTCIRSGSLDAAHAPGLVAGDSFTSGAVDIDYVSWTPNNTVYGALSTSNSRQGIWEICNGAPRPVVVNNETGARGPDIGISSAVFKDTFTVPRFASGNGFYFFAYYNIGSGSDRYGLFWHDGTRNRPLAIQDAMGNYGPHWVDSTWRTFYTSSFTANGQYTAFTAGVYTTDGGNPDGLWRVRAGGVPELVALRRIPGAYGPEAGRTWDSFDALGITADGSVVLEAYTNPGNERAVWLLEPGKAPRRVLKIGDVVQVPTASGVVQSAVTGFTIPDGGAQFSRGEDGWMGADGSLLIYANLNGISGDVWISTKLSTTIDSIFRNGFDG